MYTSLYDNTTEHSIIYNYNGKGKWPNCHKTLFRFKQVESMFT